MHARRLAECLPAVAGLIGAFNRTYISKLETGATYAGLEIIEKLAIVLRVDAAELLRVPVKKVLRDR
jgi:transcriptional regulator with XRE-family HTH domain